MENLDQQTMEALPVDPVSGNPVPPGGTPEGVRDDIPAKVSRGEFIIPENIVNYLGVKFFENLITKTEEKIAGGAAPQEEEEMDDELPFDPNELEFEEVEEQAFAEGGLVEQPKVGMVQTQPNTSNQGFRVERDRTGFLRYIPVVNGQEVGGNTTATQPTSPQTPTATPTQVGGFPQSSKLDPGEADENKKIGPNYDNMSVQEARTAAQGWDKVTSSTAGKVGTGLVGSMAGLGAGLAVKGVATGLRESAAGKVLEGQYNVPQRPLAESMLASTRLGKALGLEPSNFEQMQSWDRYSAGKPNTPGAAPATYNGGLGGGGSNDRSALDAQREVQGTSGPATAREPSWSNKEASTYGLPGGREGNSGSNAGDSGWGGGNISDKDATPGGLY